MFPKSRTKKKRTTFFLFTKPQNAEKVNETTIQEGAVAQASEISILSETNLILAFGIYTKESVVNTLGELNRRIEMLTAIDKYRKTYMIDEQIPTYVCNLETHEVSNHVTMKGGSIRLAVTHVGDDGRVECL